MKLSLVAVHTQEWLDAMTVDDLLVVSPAGLMSPVRQVIEASPRVSPIREGDWAISGQRDADVVFVRIEGKSI